MKNNEYTTVHDVIYDLDAIWIACIRYNGVKHMYLFDCRRIQIMGNWQMHYIQIA